MFCKILQAYVGSHFPQNDNYSKQHWEEERAIYEKLKTYFLCFVFKKSKLLSIDTEYSID